MAHGRILTLEFCADPHLRLGRPLVHGRMAQLAQLLDQQRLHLIGRLEGTIRGVRQIQDALHPSQHLRMFSKSLDELRFPGGEF